MSIQTGAAKVEALAALNAETTKRAALDTAVRDAATHLLSDPATLLQLQVCVPDTGVPCLVALFF